MNRLLKNRLTLLLFLGRARLGPQASWKSQALIFHVIKEGRKSGKRPFEYRFVRWHLGPYSKELEQDFGFLQHKQWIEPDYSLTAAGTKQWEKIMAANKKVKFVDGSDIFFWVEHFQGLDTASLLLEIYERHNISCYKMGAPLSYVRTLTEGHEWD